MSTTVNLDPHAEGYRFNPMHRVTAMFESRGQVKPVLEPLHGAGFGDDKIEVFVGREGVEKLDLEGSHHGKVIHFLREAQLATADEEYLFRELDQAVRGGGAVIGIVTDGDEARKKQAVEILKSHGAHEVYYWGQWSIEHF
jgi:hypothetical protein